MEAAKAEAKVRIKTERVKGRARMMALDRPAGSGPIMEHADSVRTVGTAIIRRTQAGLRRVL